MLLIEKIVLSSLGDNKRTFEEIYCYTKINPKLLRTVLINLLQLDWIVIDSENKFFTKNKINKKFSDIKFQNCFVDIMNQFYKTVSN